MLDVLQLPKPDQLHSRSQREGEVMASDVI